MSLVYQPPIPSWLTGLDGRLRAHGARTPPALLNLVRKDFSWFALNFLRDPLVDENARRAFVFWFLGATTPNTSSNPPAPELPALAWKELDTYVQDQLRMEDEDREDDD